MIFNVNALVISSVAAFLFMQSAAYPALDDLGYAASYPSQTDLDSVKEVHYRVRRSSHCDPFAGKLWFTPSPAVCAIHCVALGNSGGRCEGNVCHCVA